MESGNSIWYLGVLVVLVMAVNLVFLANVIRVIRRRRTLTAGSGGTAGGGGEQQTLQNNST